MIDYSGFESKVNEERTVLNQLKDLQESDVNYQARKVSQHYHDVEHVHVAPEVCKSQNEIFI